MSWGGDGPHNIPQGERRQIAVPGFRPGARVAATLIVIWDPVAKAFGFYVDSGAAGVVMVPVSEMTRLAGFLLGAP